MEQNVLLKEEIRKLERSRYIVELKHYVVTVIDFP